MTTPVMLVVDDNPGVALLVEQAIATWPTGGTVLTAASGIEAVTLLRAQLDRVSLIVLDYLMPGLDGWDTCVLLRALSPTVPILPYTTTYEPLPQLRDLGCLPELSKQATASTPTLLGEALWQAQHSTVPPVTIPPATLTRLQALVAAKAATVPSAETARATWQVLIVGAVGTRRAGVQALVQHTETVQVVLTTSVPAKCCAIAEAHRPVAVVGTVEDLPLLQEAHRHTALPLIAIAATFTQALIHRADPTIAGIVIEHPQEPTLAALMLSQALRTVTTGQPYRPGVLTHACSNTALTPTDRALLPYELVGTDLTTLAAQRNVTYNAQKRARLRLYDHLYLPVDRVALQGWVEAWWAAHPMIQSPTTRYPRA